MVVFNCNQCGHSQPVADEHLGKSTRCPKCREPGWVVAQFAQPQAFPMDTVVQEADTTHSAQSLANVRRSSGGNIRTSLGHGIVLNKHSTLNREWITVDDPALPAKLVGNVGITTIFEQETDYSTSQYLYSAKYNIEPSEPLTAIQTRFLTFDLWGAHNNTLGAIEILDLAAGAIHEFQAKWSVYSENEISEYYASIAYIAQVRTASGRVLKADTDPVLNEAKHFFAKFAESDLEPTPLKR